MKDKMISLIIPVYNSKDRLAKCLESVVSQSYKKLEVIIVDDCSTDGSLEICREYEKKYPFIHVYTKENEGVSAARNLGLAKAEGEYVQFADSDDMLYPDACRMLAEQMEHDKSDLVIGGYFNEKEQKDIVYRRRSFRDKEEFMKEFPDLFSGFFIHVPWNKLYRKSVLEEGFPEDIDKGEDLVFNLRALRRAEKISVLDEVLYFYHNINENSLSFKFRENAMEIEERLYHEVTAFYEKYESEKEPVFLYHYYMTAVKNKFYVLAGRPGMTGKMCRQRMREWCEKGSIRNLYLKRRHFGAKDRILLGMMRRNMTFALYLYYKR